MASKPRSTVIGFGETESEEPQSSAASSSTSPLPDVPPEMAGRPDARELREFMLAFKGIRDPKSRRRILEAIEDAVS